MDLDENFREFVALLARHDVQYLVVGGYALAAHGYPRATGDFDAWIRTSADNARRLMKVLAEFGFGEVGITEGDLTSSDCVLQLGYPPNRIDLLTRVSGLEFEDAWERRMHVSLDGIDVNFVGRDDLIVNKRATGRPQDIVDVLRLTKGQITSTD